MNYDLNDLEINFRKYDLVAPSPSWKVMSRYASIYRHYFDIVSLELRFILFSNYFENIFESKRL